MQILRGRDAAPIEPLIGRTVAVIGYGNQGHAHALNLRDSSITVLVGSHRDSRGWGRAARDGFAPMEIPKAVAEAHLVILALPDEVQPQVFESLIGPHLTTGSTVGFIHGFAIRFQLIRPQPQIGVVMVAPKGPGTLVRSRFVAGRGVPCLLAVEQAPGGSAAAHDARSLALAWAGGIGGANPGAGIIPTTFATETETDLFGEQAVLCGGMSELILAAYETLVEAGYPAESAYLECCHEVKQIADLMYERGMSGMRKAISNTAEFGAFHAGPKIIDAGVRERMRELLREITSGQFTRRMREDYAAGFKWFAAQRKQADSHPIEAVSKTIRQLGDDGKDREQ